MLPKLVLPKPKLGASKTCAIQMLKIVQIHSSLHFLAWLSHQSAFLLASRALLFWGSSLLACFPVLGGSRDVGKVLVGRA